MGRLRFTLESFLDRFGNPGDYQCYYRGKLIERVENAGYLTSLYRVWLKGQHNSIVIAKSAEIEVIS